MKRIICAVSLIWLIGTARNVRAGLIVPLPSATGVALTPPPAGTVIDRNNAERYAALIPGALMFAIRHGLEVRVIPTARIDWPRQYQEQTEKYSPQVTLDAGGTVHNYVAGLPFPIISPSDPQAGVKIAYDWRWGPFIPTQVSLVTDQKTRAWTIDSSSPTVLRDDNGRRDFRNENECDQITFLHSSRLRNANESAVDFKERGDHCGPENAAMIGTEFLDPARGDEVWFYIPTFRKWRRVENSGGYPNQSCTYSCIQFGLEYAPPKTELYTLRLVREQPILACLNANGPGAGIEASHNSGRFTTLDCEVRSAYLLDMRPRNPTSDVLMPAKVLVDSETYIYLGAELVRSSARDFDVPIWSRRKDDDASTVMLLANDFYVPGDQTDLILSLNLSPDSEQIDRGEVSSALFDPRSDMVSDGRM
jgi:hypothetical protein